MHQTSQQTCNATAQTERPRSQLACGQVTGLAEWQLVTRKEQNPAISGSGGIQASVSET